MHVEIAKATAVSAELEINAHLIVYVDVAGQILGARLKQARVHRPMAKTNHLLEHLLDGLGLAGILGVARLNGRGAAYHGAVRIKRALRVRDNNNLLNASLACLIGGHHAGTTRANNDDISLNRLIGRTSLNLSRLFGIGPRRCGCRGGRGHAGSGYKIATGNVTCGVVHTKPLPSTVRAAPCRAAGPSVGSGKSLRH